MNDDTQDPLIDNANGLLGPTNVREEHGADEPRNLPEQHGGGADKQVDWWHEAEKRHPTHPPVDRGHEDQRRQVELAAARQELHAHGQGRHDRARSHESGNLRIQQVLADWDEEQPSRTPQEQGLWDRMRKKEPSMRVRTFAGVDALGAWDSLAEYVKTEKNNGQDDARGWLLKRLGVPDSELNGMDPYEAQARIAEGLRISRFHAALFDRATRTVRPDRLHDTFKAVLTNPEQFAAPHVATFAGTLETLSAEELSMLARGEVTWRRQVYNTEQNELSRQESSKPYTGAFADVATAVIRDRFGRTHTQEERAVVPLVRATAIQLQTGRLRPSDIYTNPPDGGPRRLAIG